MVATSDIDAIGRMTVIDSEFLAFTASNTLEQLTQSSIAALLGFQIYELTHDPMQIGLLGLCEALPGITLVLYGGHLADTMSQRRIVICSMLVLSTLTAALAVALISWPRLTPFFLLLIAFLGACSRAFLSPAMSALSATVIPADNAVRGVSLLAISGGTAEVAGPAIAGLSWSVFGRLC